MTSDESKPALSEDSASPSPEPQQVKMSPLLYVLGALAIVLGVGAGLIMSSVTLFK